MMRFVFVGSLVAFSNLVLSNAALAVSTGASSVATFTQQYSPAPVGCHIPDHYGNNMIPPFCDHWMENGAPVKSSTGVLKDSSVWKETFTLTGGSGSAVIDFGGSVSGQANVDRYLITTASTVNDSEYEYNGGSSRVSAGYQSFLDGNRIASHVIAPAGGTAATQPASFNDSLQGVQVNYGKPFVLEYRFGSSALASIFTPLASEFGCSQNGLQPSENVSALECSFKVIASASTAFDLGTIFIPDGAKLLWASNHQYDVLSSPVPVAAIPEPSAYAMMVAGIALIGRFARKSARQAGAIPLART